MFKLYVLTRFSMCVIKPLMLGGNKAQVNCNKKLLFLIVSEMFSKNHVLVLFCLSSNVQNKIFKKAFFCTGHCSHIYLLNTAGLM